MTENLEALRDALPQLAEGVLVTLQLTVGGATLAFIVSVVFGLLSVSPVAPLRWFSTVVVEFFRGTSLVVQVFWLFYVMPLFGVSMGGLLTGIIALGLNYGAYGAEVVRGSINAVDKGQWEGAVALNMSPLKRMRRIIWPQAWVLMLSGYNNLLIMLIKGTAVALFIALPDFAYQVGELRIDTTVTLAYGVGLLAYYLFAQVFAIGLRLLETRARRRLGLAARSAHATAGAAPVMPAITFAEFWSWEAAAELLPELLTAFVKVTLLVTVVGTLVAVAVGMLLAVVTQIAPRPLAFLVRWVMDVIRMTPLIIQLMFASLLVPVSWDLLWVGTAVIGIHYSTYMAESFIGGIRSVDPGQWEAARALSLPQGRTWRAVVLPQAVRSTLPALGNWMISMFKDTPYLFAISVLEMVTVAQQAGGATFRYNEAFTIAGLIFLVASLVTAFAVRRLEKALVY